MIVRVLTYQLISSLPLMLIMLYFSIPIIWIYRDNKMFSALVKDITEKNYSDQALIEVTSNYIKKHPLSLYIADLQIKMIPSLFAVNDIQMAKKLVNRVRIIDVHNHLIDNIIYILFLLKENGLNEEYYSLLCAANNQLKKERNEWYQFFTGDCTSIELLKTDYSNAYLQGIKHYYIGVKCVDGGDYKKGDQLFSQALSGLNEKSFWRLLVLKGYRK